MRAHAVLLLAATTLASPARAIDITPVPIHPPDGNLVVNPHFDATVGLDGWTESATNPPVAVELCSTCDFENQLGSDGVILLVHAGTGELSTCVPVRAEQFYSIGTWILLPHGSEPGFAGVHVQWMPDRECAGPPQSGTTVGVDASNLDAYQYRLWSEGFIAPAETKAVKLSLYVAASAGSDSFKASFDEPQVIPEPDAAGLLAALSVLFRLQRHRKRWSAAPRALSVAEQLLIVGPIDRR